MPRKGHSVEQISAALKQHDLGMSVADIARKLGIVEATFYRWKEKYRGGLSPVRCVNSDSFAMKTKSSSESLRI